MQIAGYQPDFTPFENQESILIFKISLTFMISEPRGPE